MMRAPFTAAAVPRPGPPPAAVEQQHMCRHCGHMWISNDNACGVCRLQRNGRWSAKDTHELVALLCHFLTCCIAILHWWWIA